MFTLSLKSGCDLLGGYIFQFKMYREVLGPPAKYDCVVENSVVD